MDPRPVGRLSESLLATTRLSWGGLAHQAVAAIENACLDIHGKALGVPVHALFGGPFRERVPVYWTHCGSYRVRHAAFYETSSASSRCARSTISPGSDARRWRRASAP